MICAYNRSDYENKYLYIICNRVLILIYVSINFPKVLLHILINGKTKKFETSHFSIPGIVVVP